MLWVNSCLDLWVLIRVATFVLLWLCFCKIELLASLRGVPRILIFLSLETVVPVLKIALVYAALTDAGAYLQIRAPVKVRDGGSAAVFQVLRIVVIKGSRKRLLPRTKCALAPLMYYRIFLGFFQFLC